MAAEGISPRPRLGELLRRRGAIEPHQLDQGLAHQRRHGRRLGEVLIAAGTLSEEALAGALADQLGLRRVDLTGPLPGPGVA